MKYKVLLFLVGFFLFLLPHQEIIARDRLKKEVRGVRVSFSTVAKYGSEEIGRHLAKYNFNMLLPTVIKEEDLLPLEELVKKCHQAGIEVHPTICTFSTHGHPLKPEASYLAVRPDGKLKLWRYCPNNRKVVEYKIGFIKRIIKAAAIDGFELDYIRYSGDETCYCENCKKKFMQDTGVKLKNFPQEVLRGGRYEALWDGWRKTVINRFVKEVKEEVKKINPTIIFSVSTWNVGCAPIPTVITPAGEGYGVEQGQDYARLSELCDFVRPMLYHKKFGVNTEWLEKMTEKAVKNSKGARVYVGITAAYNSTPEDLEKAILAVRKGGAGGIIIHPYWALFENHKFDRVLRKLFPAKAILPHRLRKKNIK